MLNTIHLLELSAPSVAKFSNDAIVLLDRAGKMLFVNERIECWLGYKKEELVGKNIAFAGLMPPASVAVAIKNLALRFLGRDLPPYNLEFITKDGRTLTSTVKAQLIKDEDGKIIADLAVIIDVSEKKEYEKAITLEKEKTDIYIDIVGTIVVILDKEGKITLLNKKGCEILKITKKDAIGKNWFDEFVPKKDLSKTKETFMKIISGSLEGVEEFENKVITTTGEERLISWHNSFLKDSKGNVYESISSGDDITESKKNKEKVIELNQQIETILNSSRAMIFYKDKENRFIRVNETLAKANKKSRQEMEGKTCWDLYSKEVADRYLEDDKEIIDSGKSKLDIIEKMETPAGTVWLQTDKIPYRDQKGEVIGIIGFALDITERKKQEGDSKKQTEELEKINQLMIGRELKMVELKHELEIQKNEIEKLKEGDKNG